MIYITGNTHGDLSRFFKTGIKKMKENDILIICGDFGFIWDGSENEKKNLEQIGKFKFKTLFVDGTHENFDILDDEMIKLLVDKYSVQTVKSLLEQIFTQTKDEYNSIVGNELYKIFKFTFQLGQKKNCHVYFLLKLLLNSGGRIELKSNWFIFGF